MTTFNKEDEDTLACQLIYSSFLNYTKGATVLLDIGNEKAIDDVGYIASGLYKAWENLWQASRVLAKNGHYAKSPNHIYGLSEYLKDSERYYNPTQATVPKKPYRKLCDLDCKKYKCKTCSACAIHFKNQQSCDCSICREGYEFCSECRQEVPVCLRSRCDYCEYALSITTYYEDTATTHEASKVLFCGTNPDLLHGHLSQIGREEYYLTLPIHRVVLDTSYNSYKKSESVILTASLDAIRTIRNNDQHSYISYSPEHSIRQASSERLVGLWTINQPYYVDTLLSILEKVKNNTPEYHANHNQQECILLNDKNLVSILERDVTVMASKVDRKAKKMLQNANDLSKAPSFKGENMNTCVIKAGERFINKLKKYHIEPPILSAQKPTGRTIQVSTIMKQVLSVRGESFSYEKLQQSIEILHNRGIEFFDKGRIFEKDIKTAKHWLSEELN